MSAAEDAGAGDGTTPPTPPTPSGSRGATTAPPPAAITETHTSVLIFLGDRVYKIKKSADLGFLDFRTREARLRACQAEVDLNRRLAPDIYLGVADINGLDGEVCDHMVVMRRLPPERRLSTLVTGGVDVTGELRAIARLLADFHARCETSTEIAEAGSPGTLRGLWDEGVAGVEPYVGSVLDTGTIEAISRLAARYLDGREPLLRQRQRDGHVRDGHGDLLADDIYCLPDGPRILDCLEFDQRLRVGDILGDVGFLAMDLERLHRPDLAAFLLDEYRGLAGESHPRSLANLYIAYRAFVRCKVACTRHAQGSEPAAAEARALAALALAHLRQGRVRLVLVGGPAESGRRELATGLAEATGWTLLEATGRPDANADADADLGTDAEADADLLRRARHALERGESVILAAAWARRADRDRAAALAGETATDLVQLRSAGTGEGAVPGQVGALGHRVTPPHGGRSTTRHTDPWPEATTLGPASHREAVLRAVRATATAG